MKIAALAALAVLVQLFLFLCSGSVLMKLGGRREWSLSGSVLLGFFAYFSIFEVICFLCEITLAPLSRLSVIMTAVAAAVMLAGTLTCGKDWAGRLKTLPERIRRHGFLLIVLIAVTAAVCFFALIYTDASADSDYYVGMTSTALFTNSIGRFEPSTGRLLKAVNPRYAYALYPYHNAVVADIFRIPAIVSARSVMSVVNALISCLAFYHLGKVLFQTDTQEGSRESVRKAETFTIILLVLNLFSSTIYLPGAFLFSRSFEGKHLIVNAVLPCVLMACVCLYREDDPSRLTAKEDRALSGSLFLVMLAGVCFSASVVIAAITLFLAAFPHILVKRSWKRLFLLLCSLLPVAVWIILYMLNSHHVFVILSYR